jgi:1-acyl-sn-glycerol-3-phosphate acyltransferase
MIRGPRDTLFYRVLHVVVPPLFRLLYRTRIHGLEHLPASGPVVLASNHLANIDPFILGVATPRQIHFMAKSELWSFPPLGWAVEKLGSFKVRRGEPDRDALRTAVEYERDGAVVGIFPEGHRQPEGTLGEPLPGVAFLSLRPGVTTVPVVVIGTNHILENGLPRFPRVTVAFGPPVEPAVASGSKAQQHREFAGRLMDALQRLLEGQGVAVRRAAGGEQARP